MDRGGPDSAQQRRRAGFQWERPSGSPGLPIAGIFDVPCHWNLGPAWAAMKNVPSGNRLGSDQIRFVAQPDRASFQAGVQRAIAAAISSMLASECWFRYSATQSPISSHSRSSSAGPSALSSRETSSRAAARPPWQRDSLPETAGLVAGPAGDRCDRDRRRDPHGKAAISVHLLPVISLPQMQPGLAHLLRNSAHASPPIGVTRPALPERTGCPKNSAIRQREGRRSTPRPRRPKARA